MTPRPLVVSEIPLIVPLVEAYLTASKLPIIFDAEKVVRLWRVMYESNKGELCGLWIDGHLAGLFGVHEMDSSFGEVHGANEWIWWVQPDLRHLCDGMSLLAWAEQWAQARGVGLQVGAYDCVHGAVMARLYARRGYERRGSIFTKFW